METTPDLELKKEKKKKDKVRSAWISFVGRILAQLVGAAATVTLGVIVLHRYSQPVTHEPPAITVVVIAPTAQDPAIDEAPTSSPGGTARQVEMARAIATAVSGTLRTRQ